MKAGLKHKKPRYLAELLIKILVKLSSHLNFPLMSQFLIALSYNYGDLSSFLLWLTYLKSDYELAKSSRWNSSWGNSC